MAQRNRFCTVAVVLSAFSTMVWFAGNSWGGPGCCGSPPASSASKPTIYGDGGGSAKPRPPEPYRGQKRCPVCDGALGSQGEPVSVDASLTTPAKKTFLQKIGLAKASPEKLSYFVCGPECAAQAQGSPNTYLVTVIAGRSGSR